MSRVPNGTWAHGNRYDNPSFPASYSPPYSLMHYKSQPNIFQCDHLCGQGKQTRKVTCFKKNEAGKIEVLENSVCEGDVPESEKPCELRPCAGLDWVVSEWSGVSNKALMLEK